MHPILSRRGLLALVAVAFLLLGALLAIASSAGRQEWPPAFALALPLCLLLAFFCLAAWYPCRALPLVAGGSSRLVTTHLAASLFIASVWVGLGSGLAALLETQTLMGGAMTLFSRERSLFFAVGSTLYLLAASFYYLQIALDTARRAESKALELTVFAREAELSALKSQIDPHFLFNSLNAIASLAGSDGPAAREMALSLADFLRHSRAAARQSSLRLDEELDLASAYLAVERVRFGPRLRVALRIDDAARGWRVPPLMLQPLVENAVRHGVSHVVVGGTVRVEAGLFAERLRITVTNPFEPSAAAKNRGANTVSGTGLENVRQRLRLLYGGEARLATERRDEAFVVEIELPHSLEAKP